jgi:hypothetical protein
MSDPSHWSHSTGEAEQFQASINQANHTSTKPALTVLQASVSVGGKAKDLAATISSGQSAKKERETKRKARDEKERAEKEQEWKERQDREREKEKEKK